MKQEKTNVNLFIFTFQFSESPLSSWSTPQAASQSTHHLTSGRSWTVAGTSLANMFPEQVKSKHHYFNFEENFIPVFWLQLRVAKRRDNDNEEGGAGATPTSSHHNNSSPTGKIKISLYINELFKYDFRVHR
jgi:hypothetical protein